ncbi:MAG TPA: hypothetical protein VFY92_10125 [Hyphomicrobiaceae bacterium]|nr:hypothetical protein [Hyphomicrobiaceae bacterium]
MRTLLALALLLAGAVALPGDADARRRGHAYHPRAYDQPYYYGAPRYYAPPRAYRPRLSREQLLCEERAQNEDPSGQYAGFPCWAREAFGRGGGGGGRR